MKLGGGAKSIAFKMAKESSLSFDGVGRVLRSAGGGIGLSGFWFMNRPAFEAEEPGRGLIAFHRPPPVLDKVDPALGLLPRGPPGCIGDMGPGPRCLGPGIGRLLLGGGVIALRVTGAA